MPAIKRDSLVSIVFCLLVGGLIFADTLRYPAVQGQGFGQGPGFYPQLLAGLLTFLGVLNFLKGMPEETDALTGNRGEPHPGFKSVIILNGLAVIFISLMPYLGFYVSGFLLTFLTVLLIRRPGGMGHLGMDLGFSIGIVLVIYLVFVRFVGIELPGPMFLD